MKILLSDAGSAGKQDTCKAHVQKPRKQTVKRSRKGSRGKDGNSPPNSEDEESEAEEEDTPTKNAEVSQEMETQKETT